MFPHHFTILTELSQQISDFSISLMLQSNIRIPLTNKAIINNKTVNITFIKKGYYCQTIISITFLQSYSQISIYSDGVYMLHIQKSLQM